MLIAHPHQIENQGRYGHSQAHPCCCGAVASASELNESVKTRGSVPTSDLVSYQLVYDDSMSAIVAIAGNHLADQVGHVFLYNGTTWTNGPTGPSNRTKSALVFDSTRHQTILFGGQIPQRPPALVAFASDTWTLANGAWQLVDNASDQGLKVQEAAFAFDSKRGNAVVVGGREALRTSNKTWTYDGRAWHIAGPCNLPTMSQAIAFDSQRGGMIMFGGLTRPNSYLEPSQLTEFFDGQSWTSTMPIPSPPGRSEHAMAYDSARKRTVLFGGVRLINSTPVNSDDTWEFDETGAWRELVLATRPSPRRRHAMAYDAKRKRVVLFGGTSAEVLNSGAKLNDTWEFDGTAWQQWTPTDDNVPSARQGAGMAFDVKRGVIVLQGGVDGSGATNELWEFDGDRWIQQFPLNPPAAPDAVNLAFDTVTNTILMFNGDTPSDEAADLRSYTFASSHPAEQCIVDEDADQDGLSACADPDCVGRCYPNCAATFGSCDRNVGPHCGDGTCDPAFEDYLLCSSDCMR